MEGCLHIERLAAGLGLLEAELARIERWGRTLTDDLLSGTRLFTAGNGGSAAEAQHLAAELVGRYSTERMPLSAICLHAETSSLTAITNDYGAEEAFARQVRAHGRPGDTLLALSTSGRSPNLLAAARTAAKLGIRTWALCGPAPNALAELCEEAVCLDAPAPTVQELHLVAVHLLCGVVDDRVGSRRDRRATTLAGAPAA